MTKNERRERGIKIGVQIYEILRGYPDMDNQEVMEVLGIALFWLMSFVYVTCKVEGGSDAIGSYDGERKSRKDQFDGSRFSWGEDVSSALSGH